MPKKISFKNASLIANSKSFNTWLIKDFNFSFDGNHVFSFISENKTERDNFANVLLGKKTLSFGEVILDQEYFENKKNYRGEKFEYINDISIDKLDSDKKISQIFNDILNNKKITRKNYASALKEKKIFIKRIDEKIKLIENNIQDNENQLFTTNDINSIFINEIEVNKYKHPIKLKKIELNNQLSKLKKEENVNKKLYKLKKEHLKHQLKIETSRIRDVFVNEKNELNERIYNDEEIEQKNEVIFKRLRNEVLSLIKYIRNISISGFEITTETSNFLKRIENLESKSFFKDSIPGLLKFAKNIIETLNSNHGDELVNRINFINLIQDSASAINTNVFNNFYNGELKSMKEKLNYNLAVINDINKNLDELIMRDKQEKNMFMRKLWEFKMISLRFQAQIYREKNDIINEYCEFLKNEIFYHDNSMYEIYSLALDFYNTYSLVDISLNKWRLNRKKLATKLEKEIWIKDFNFEINKLKNTNKEIKQKFNYEYKNADDKKTFESNSSKDENNQTSIDELIKQKEIFINEINFLKDRISGKDIEDRELLLTYLLEDAGMNSEILNSKLSDLSNNRKQMVLTIKAILEGKEIIILDNPTSELGRNAETDITRSISNISNKHHIMFIILTNDIELASQISDTIAIINWGSIVEYGDSNLVINKPAHPYTKAMIKDAKKIRFLKSEENSIVDYDGKTLNHNMFTKLEHKEIEKNHYVLATDVEFKKWVGE